MSEEKLKILVKKYPDYSGIFETVFNWFVKNPDKDIRIDSLYTLYPPVEIDVVFFILKKEKIVRTIYRVLDVDGTKIGDDFNDLNDIPDVLDGVWGNPINTKDLSVVPHYHYDKNLLHD